MFIGRQILNFLRVPQNSIKHFECVHRISSIYIHCMYVDEENVFDMNANTLHGKFISPHSLPPTPDLDSLTHYHRQLRHPRFMEPGDTSLDRLERRSMGESIADGMADVHFQSCPCEGDCRA